MHEIQSTTRILQRHLQHDLKSDIEVSNIKFPHYQAVFKTRSFTSLIFNIDQAHHVWYVKFQAPHDVVSPKMSPPWPRPQNVRPQRPGRCGLQESRHRASEALACQPCGSQLDETSIICTRCLAPCFCRKNGWQNICPTPKTNKVRLMVSPCK